MLVERGDVVAHPDVVSDHPGWRYATGHSFDSVEDWRRFLRRSIRSGWETLVMTSIAPAAMLLLAVGFVVAIVNGEVAPFWVIALGPLFILLFGRQLPLRVQIARDLRLNIRARRILREAESLRQTSSEAMLMRLWWSVGHGHGPVAIASLSSTLDSIEEWRVPVVGISLEMLRDERVPVLVQGRGTRAPLIAVDGVFLWPADEAYRRSPSGRESLERPPRSPTKR
jgi:hypothetical protein